MRDYLVILPLLLIYVSIVAGPSIKVEKHQNNKIDLESTFDQNPFDTSPPIIDSPDDLVYTYGTIGNNITWTPFDENPISYEIIRDASLLRWGWWNHSFEQISIDVDGL